MNKALRFSHRTFSGYIDPGYNEQKAVAFKIKSTDKIKGITKHCVLFEGSAGEVGCCPIALLKGRYMDPYVHVRSIEKLDTAK